jgi:hypothetical protein
VQEVKEVESKEQDSVKTPHRSNKQMVDVAKDVDKYSTHEPAISTTTSIHNITWASPSTAATTSSSTIVSSTAATLSSSTIVSSPPGPPPQLDVDKNTDLLQESMKNTASSPTDLSVRPPSKKNQDGDTALMTLYSSQRQKLNKILSTIHSEKSESTSTSMKTDVSSPGKIEKEQLDSKHVFADIGDVVVEEKSNSERMSIQSTTDSTFLFTRDQVDHRIDDAIDALRDDVEECIRNLHVEFVKQMYYQETHFVSLVKDLQVSIASLKDENEALREENARLRNRSFL